MQRIPIVTVGMSALRLAVAATALVEEKPLVVRVHGNLAGSSRLGPRRPISRPPWRRSRLQNRRDLWNLGPMGALGSVIDSVANDGFDRPGDLGQIVAHAGIRRPAAPFPASASAQPGRRVELAMNIGVDRPFSRCDLPNCNNIQFRSTNDPRIKRSMHCMARPVRNKRCLWPQLSRWNRAQWRDLQDERDSDGRDADGLVRQMPWRARQVGAE